MIRLLARYRVDRADGLTASGPERLVVLVLQPLDGPEMAVAISRVDAMMLSVQLSAAAAESGSGH